MKTTLHLIITLFMAAGLLVSQRATAQIDYFQDFATGNNNWTTTDFKTTSVAACNGSALRAAYKNYPDATARAVTLSPRLGISNGERIILNYSYKVLLYNNVLPYQPAQGNNWGLFTVEYSVTPNGPWVIIDNVNRKNHLPTDGCATREIAFTPPNGSAVYLRLSVGGGTDYGNGYCIYIDDISALQDNLTITSVAQSSPLKVYPNPVTDYLTVEYAGAISSLQLFNNQGEAVSVENIGNDYSRLDLSGLDRGNYTLKLIGDNDEEISTVNVEKKEVN